MPSRSAACDSACGRVVEVGGLRPGCNRTSPRPTVHHELVVPTCHEVLARAGDPRQYANPIGSGSPDRDAETRSSSSTLEASQQLRKEVICFLSHGPGRIPTCCSRSCRQTRGRSTPLVGAPASRLRRAHPTSQAMPWSRRKPCACAELATTSLAPDLPMTHRHGCRPSRALSCSAVGAEPLSRGEGTPGRCRDDQQWLRICSHPWESSESTLAGVTYRSPPPAT